ncbi:MAG: hypothetical protein NUV97_00890 [archaeon]|nr:hypothetical protein [archaeon]MCR4323483.1 hypothetical protein [Nanoarchaeota archaeon]
MEDDTLLRPGRFQGETGSIYYLDGGVVYREKMKRFGHLTFLGADPMPHAGIVLNKKGIRLYETGTDEMVRLVDKLTRIIGDAPTKESKD